MAASPFAPEFDKLWSERIVAGVDAADGGVAHSSSWRVRRRCCPHRPDCRLGRRVPRTSSRCAAHKLAKTGADERHAFIVVTLTSGWDVFHALTMDGYSHLLAMGPAPPDEASHDH
jgi:hypothetical protein